MYKKELLKELTEKYFYGNISVSFTLLSDDITKGEKPQGTPYVSRRGDFDENLKNARTLSELTVEKRFGGYYLKLSSNAENLSEFGLNLPFDFMGKKSGKGWQNQYLFNSPYNSADNENIFCYLTNPCGKNVVVLFLNEADGWKMDYSLFSGGQYFDNLKVLKSFDKAYYDSGETAEENKKPERKWILKRKKNFCGKKNPLEILIFETENYGEALEKVAKIKKLPAAYYEKNHVKLGEKLKISVFGDFDYLKVGSEKYKNEGGFSYISPKKSGLLTVTPYKNGKKGLNCGFYAYLSINSLLKKSMYSVSESDLKTGDGNLCEWQCHVSAISEYMLRFGKSKTLIKKIKPELEIITETNEEKAIDRQTIFYKARKGYPAYNVFNSDRVQEQFFGAGILLAAYKLFKTKKYLNYAIRALTSVLKNHQDFSGAIQTYREWSKSVQDYTTVCCLIIPLIDTAEFLKDKNPEKSAYFYDCAKKTAEYVYNRGLNFPTETDEQNFAEPFVEEGSMSCSALTLLYYCAKVEKIEKYISRAKQILEIHDNWVIKTHISPMFFSTLRWWETKWEGDKDGNALCCGHAWTIWRAEADYWYYYLTGDETYLNKAKNGFFSNFSKINEKGQSYACYQPDYITGGGFTTRGEQVNFKIVNGFPKQTDSGLSRYVWSRALNCILTDKNVFFGNKNR